METFTPEVDYSETEVARANQQLVGINEYLVDKTPPQIIEWAVDSFDPQRIFTLTSAGFSAPLTLDLLADATERDVAPSIPVIHNDTGMLTSEVYYYRDQVLEPNFGFTSVVTGPNQQAIDEILRTELWKTDENEYRRRTKYGPIDAAIALHGIQLLITGVRSDQSQNREELSIVTYGSNGELRVNPNFYTAGPAVSDMLAEIAKRRQLEPHPLNGKVAFIDDWPFMGGPKTECGINSARRLVKVPMHAMPELIALKIPRAA